MLSRALALGLAAAGLLLVGVTTGGSGPQASAGTAADSEIRFMTFGAPEELAAYRALIAEYRRVEPRGKVSLTEASDRSDLLARLATSLAGGSPPDVFLLNYRFYGQFAAKGVLEPLESRLNASKAFRQRDFYEQALDAFRFGGTLTCLPQNISSLVVYYNRDLLRKAGVAEPQSGWTWQQLLRAAARLTIDRDRDGRVEQYGLGIEPTLIRLAPLIWSNGGQLVDDERRPTRLAVDGPKAVEALSEFLRLRSAWAVIPTEQEVEGEDDEARFLNGRTAMIFSSRRSTPTFRKITSFDWDVAPLPRFARPASILHSDAYCLAKASKQKDAAWRFIEFAVGPRGASIMARTGRTVPSLRSVANSPAFLDPRRKPSRSRVFLDTIPSIRAVPSISTWPEIEDAADVVLEQALYESEVDAGEIARRLVDRTRRLFERAER